MFIRNVTAAEVEQVKADLKRMGISATIKTTAPVKRVAGSIAVKQRKTGDKWCFTEEEAKRVREYLLNSGFVGGSIERSDYIDLCFCQGFTSIFKAA